MTASFDLELRPSDDPTVVVVEVAGELDLTNARDLEDQLVALARRAPALALDLTRVLFVDSAALHALFRTARAVGAPRFGLVVPPSSPILRALEIVGLPQLVTTRPSLEELLTALSGRSA